MAGPADVLPAGAEAASGDAATYARWARYYDALYAFKDYAAEADSLARLADAARPGARTLLDIACGSGRHLEQFARRFEVAGVDLDPNLLAIAAARLPGVPLHRGDMRDFALGRRFDLATCLFSSIAFMRDEAMLRDAFATFAAHLEPGGLLFVEPWFGPDTFWADTITSRSLDDAGLKIAWMYTSRRDGGLSILDNHFLVGTAAGIERLHDRHVLGLFTDGQYRAALRAAGFDVERIQDQTWKRGLYVARKTGA
jgi:SAM-dependent methyltransferase